MCMLGSPVGREAGQAVVREERSRGELNAREVKILCIVFEVVLPIWRFDVVPFRLLPFCRGTMGQGQRLRPTAAIGLTEIPQSISAGSSPVRTASWKPSYMSRRVG